MDKNERYWISIIVCFFGKFPYYIDLWLKSCSLNPSINWIVFTDQEQPSAPQNVRFIKTNLLELCKLFSEKLGFQVTLDHPYKICDFRPAFGIIFDDYLKEFDFWGHCDMDMIFGDIRNFITEDILKKHDKVIWLGHIAMYRNAPEVNERYKLPGSAVNYKTAFCSDKFFAFDETSINEIFRHHNFPIYHEPILIDTIFYRKHFSGFNIKNYPRQVFYWERGHVYQAYQVKGHIHQKGFMSIHFQKRGFDQYDFDAQKAEAFYISPDGFFEKVPGVINPEDFDKYNKNPGFLFEFMVMQWYFIKLRYTRLVQWIRRLRSNSDKKL